MSDLTHACDIPEPPDPDGRDDDYPEDEYPHDDEINGYDFCNAAAEELYGSVAIVGFNDGAHTAPF